MHDARVKLVQQRLESEGHQLKATGFMRDKPSDIVRHLTAQTDELKKQMPVMPAAPSL